MTKWLAIISTLLLVVTNGIWLYTALDLAVTEKYRQQEVYEDKSTIVALRRLCSHLVSGMPKSEAVALLSAVSPDFQPFEKEGYLNSTWLLFRLANSETVETQAACE